MVAKTRSEKVEDELRALRAFELLLARQNPYDNRNTKRFLIEAHSAQARIIKLCGGYRPEAKRLVDAWFKRLPFLKNEGRGPRAPTGRSSNLLASILAATSRAPRRLQSRWSRAFNYIDWEHGNSLNKPKLEWILEDRGGIRKLANRAAQAMPARKRQNRHWFKPLLD
jgi:hypothetical protein